MTILTTTLIISGIAAVFAFFLSVSDKYVADYGEVEVTINEEKHYVVEGGKTLLNALRDQKIFIPSACGGKGSCGYCKVQVSEGGGQMLATEAPWMSPEEVAKGVRLSCQCKVKQPMKIQISEELFNVREYDMVIESIEPMTPTIKKFRFRLPEGETIDFKPGQYVQILIPEYDGSDEEVFRAYSIASSKTDSKHVELLIGYTGGTATTYLHQMAKVGDVMRVNGPFGDFYYLDCDSDIIMVAAGTGFAPIRSILWHMKNNDIRRKARFFFGAKTPEDLFLLDEMKMFEEELYDFKFQPTLTRTTPEMNWSGDTGRVNSSIERYVEDPGDYSCYLCGNPAMIESIMGSLEAKHIPQSRIYFDKF